MDYQEQFRIRPGSKVKLEDHDPGFKHGTKEEAESGKLAFYGQRLRELQELLHVNDKHSLLVVLQALDTGGKDGTINHVLGSMNPQGFQVSKFGVPTPEEAAHDFLWRAHRATPARGDVAVFNRSYYEDVLVVRVHKLAAKAVWSKRYALINAFEKALVEQDTVVIKFFLNISKEEQLKRFKDRLDDPSKQWKISEADYAERRYWDEYVAAYQDALSECSTEHAPWYVIPSNHKWFRNLAVARIMVEHLEALKMSYPRPAVDLKEIRADYEAAKAGRAKGD
ncbi:MAG TPA: polyphosphate kinase 2 family protein [Gammaproteobacteria bacterium]|nr:polyphosphate kinase 2 family protein [Gammaproteobacteria bacterium]